MTTRTAVILAPVCLTFAVIFALALVAGADAVIAGGVITLGALFYVAGSADRAL